MRKSRLTEAQIVAVLTEGEAGVPVAELFRKHGSGRIAVLAECGLGPICRD